MTTTSGIFFFSEGTNYRIRNKKKIKDIIKKIISDAKLSLESLNFILCNDDFLYKINLQFLKHDTLTDIITFDYCSNEKVKGEAYISLDRVKENAKKYKQILFKELLRVIFHGTLHLVGYNDKKKKEITIMRAKEDFYLREFFDLL